ncbi:DNA polymerase III subunit beta [Caldibacillus debilis]|uniref:Beta sliding clamp n=1 Tax=Caldibacillus debilis TaxID=301148 RepID=A0A150M7P8_9BACI|nr:DNA polymerase III subunit beta [Caldibacillus debilis]KYD20583.1 DNA polymerase III beta subunit [Caldibacillus debilis]
MKFKIASGILSDGLKKVEKVVNWKHNIPILQGVYMECTPDEITLIGSDSDESLRYHIPVDGENVDVVTPGKILLPKQAVELIKKLKGEIVLEREEHILVIKYGKKSQFSFVTSNVEEYPKLPEINFDGPSLILKGTEFSNVIRKTAFAAAENDIRPILMGLNIIANSNELIAVATNSHRLGRVILKKGTDKEKQVVIPAKVLEKHLKIFDLEKDVNVYFGSKNQVVFKNGSLVLYVRMLEGNYPSTERLIPTEFLTEITLNRLELLETLDRIGGLSDDGKTGVVKLQIRSGVAELSTNHSQIGKGIEILELQEISGDNEFSVSFASKYMMDALKSIDDDYICFKYTGNLRPFLVTPSSGSPEIEETQLILPVRERDV